MSSSSSSKQHNATTSSDSSSSSSIASEVLSASLGGAVSAAILYPLEVLKTKMQAAVKEEDDDDNDDALQDGEERKEQTNKKKKSKQQDNMISFACQVYEQEGWSVFVRGFETSAFQSALEKALYFFAYTVLKNTHAVLCAGRPLDTVTNLLLACAAEWAHLPVTLPVDAWTTRIQTTKSNDGTGGGGALAVLLTMLGDPNVNFYKGISAYYLLCLKPALQYTVYEQVKEIVVKTRRNKTLSAAEAFLLGMIARTIATVAVFPFLRAKVVLQTQKTDKSNSNNNTKPLDTVPGSAAATKETTSTLCSKCQGVAQKQKRPQQQQQQQQQTSKKSSSSTSSSNSVLSLLMQLYQRDGIAGLYQGLGPELTRGIFSAALMLMIKERISGTVQLFLQRHSRSAGHQQQRRVEA